MVAPGRIGSATTGSSGAIMRFSLYALDPLRTIVPGSSRAHGDARDRCAGLQAARDDSSPDWLVTSADPQHRPCATRPAYIPDRRRNCVPPYRSGGRHLRRSGRRGSKTVLGGRLRWFSVGAELPREVAAMFSKPEMTVAIECPWSRWGALTCDTGKVCWSALTVVEAVTTWNNSVSPPLFFGERSADSPWVQSSSVSQNPSHLETSASAWEGRDFERVRLSQACASVPRACRDSRVPGCRRSSQHAATGDQRSRRTAASAISRVGDGWRPAPPAAAPVAVPG